MWNEQLLSELLSDFNKLYTEVTLIPTDIYRLFLPLSFPHAPIW